MSLSCLSLYPLRLQTAASGRRSVSTAPRPAVQLRGGSGGDVVAGGRIFRGGGARGRIAHVRAAPFHSRLHQTIITATTTPAAPVKSGE